jgi:threonine/homoserine/homoserine lactone efflux protein
MFMGETLTEMPSPTAYGLFVLAALTLLILPGPAVLYIVSRSVDQGRAAGFASVLGVTTGTLIQIAAATVGLSSLVLESALAFDIVKYAGAAYLIVLGIMRLRDRGELRLDRSPRTLRRLYAQGVVVNTLNPKTALFIFALLPQFVDPGRGRVWVQVLVLGLTLCALGLVSDGTYALAAGAIADRLRRSRAQRWIGGSVLIGLGVAAAAVSRPTSR